MKCSENKSGVKTFTVVENNRTIFQVKNIEEDLYLYLKTRQFKSRKNNSEILKYWARYMPMEHELPEYCNFFLEWYIPVYNSQQKEEEDKIEIYQAVADAIREYCKYAINNFYKKMRAEKGEKIKELPDTNEAYLSALSEFVEFKKTANNNKLKSNVRSTTNVKKTANADNVTNAEISADA